MRAPTTYEFIQQAVPDKAQLQCGKLLCVSSLFNTIARVERASTRQLAVYFCSEEAVGLTEKVDPRRCVSVCVLGGGADALALCCYWPCH